MTDLEVLKVQSTPWNHDPSTNQLVRKVSLHTNLGERMQFCSITRADRESGQKAMGILITTNYKVIERSVYKNSPQNGDWLLALCKIDGHTIKHFPALCSDTDFGSLLSILEPKDMKSFVELLALPRNISIELNGTNGSVDLLYLPVGSNFVEAFNGFWNATIQSSSAPSNVLTNRKRWLGLF